jgi:uncharacterized protein YndB with AHSA1/START domain
MHRAASDLSRNSALLQKYLPQNRVMARTLHYLCLCVALFAFGVHDAHAQLIGPNGFTVRVRTLIRATPEKVYETLVQVDQWWDPKHTFSGDAKNLSMDAHPGGCFCERLPRGGGVEHLRVVYAAPGDLLRLTGALGPLQPAGVTGSLSIKLSPSSTGTTVDLTYAVGGFSEVGFTQLAPAVGSMLTEQMNRLRSLMETGRPAAPGR